MIDKKKLTDIISDYLADSDKFLIALKVSPQNKVLVFIDGDTGVSIKDCAGLSRHIESFFDRDLEDFELNVSSVGVGSPLQMVRQYHNNIGRMIQVATEEKSMRGRLKEVTEKGILVEKEKPSNKKHPSTRKEGEEIALQEFMFEQIREAKIVPSFK